MNPHRLYIEQTSFDGSTYTRGKATDTYATWNVVCSKSVFRNYGDPKDVATRSWLDEYGDDVYIPADVKLKKFDAEFTFLCNGTEADVKYNVRNFQLFLLGKECHYKRWDERFQQYVEAAVAPVGARLVMFDTYNSIGWKDVRCKSFSADTIVMDNSDNEIVIEFKVVFEVNDPWTAVELMSPVGGGDPTLRW